jgi:dipeptidyl aminopeptidase/acylaminoacyl peptidase
MTPRTAPYGSWKSPITADRLTKTGIGLGQVAVSGDAIYWLEGRPLEGGRSVVVRRGRDGSVSDVMPEGFNVRTCVHEYGGGAYWERSGVVYFANFDDQRLYVQVPGGVPEPITPEPPSPKGFRYADGRLSPEGSWIVCVRERHEPGREAINELIALPSNGRGGARVVESGHDFYSSPRFSPDGRRLAWITWDHPRMPWDGTELWVAEVHAGLSLGPGVPPPRVESPAAGHPPGRGDAGGRGFELRERRRIAGGPSESIVQPAWSPEGILHFVSDRSGWWNLYAVADDALRGGAGPPREGEGAWHGAESELRGTEDARALPLAPMEAEFAGPHWSFGLSTYAFLSGGRIACVYTKDGIEHLGIVRRASGRVEPIDLPFTWFGHGGTLASDGGDRLVFVGATPLQSPAVVTLDVASGRLDVVKESVTERVDPRYLSSPEPIEFPTDGGLTAHALFYPPRNGDYTAPEGTRPPLLVTSHGGPTSATSSELRLGIQFWTSRGFAVADVNYGGSTGYGRAYRERLRGNWGIVDTADCINAARHLERAGRVDGRRMAIRGGSAGGYTTLCALVFHDVFAAGASYYGVADLEALAKETHKFESRYLDSLVGPYPEARGTYRRRSPIHFADRLSCPVILLQGLEDRVVPPSQAEVMVAALREKKLPFAYVTFEGEQHGFRKAENIRRALEAECYFYAKVFGFEPADRIDPVEIENLPGAQGS